MTGIGNAILNRDATAKCECKRKISWPPSGKVAATLRKYSKSQEFHEEATSLYTYIGQNYIDARQKSSRALPPSFPLAIMSVTNSHFWCVLTWRSLGEQPAEPAAEAGLRGDHAVPEGGHSGVGEDAGDARQGKGQIQPGKHTRCCRTRYTHWAAQDTCVNASQKCLLSAPRHQSVGKHCLKLHVWS